MAKTLLEASEDYVALVEDIFSETNLSAVVNLRVFRMAKAGKEVIKVQKANEIAERAWQEDDIVVVSLYEEAFDLVDDQTKRIWIENALAQVAFDYEKDKLVLGKEPTITVTLGVYDKYKDVLIQKLQLATMTMSQIKEKEKLKKQQEKEAKKAKKANKNGGY